MKLTSGVGQLAPRYSPASSAPTAATPPRSSLSIATFNVMWLFRPLDPRFTRKAYEAVEWGLPRRDKHMKLPGWVAKPDEFSLPWSGQSDGGGQQPADWELHLERMAGVIAGMGADIVVLQEVQDLSILELLNTRVAGMLPSGREPYHLYCLLGNDSFTGQNVALMSRVRPFSFRTLFREFKRGEGNPPSKHFVARFNGVDVGLDGELVLVGAHLLGGNLSGGFQQANEIGRREEQVRALAQWVRANAMAGEEQRKQYVAVAMDANDVDHGVLERAYFGGASEASEPPRKANVAESILPRMLVERAGAELPPEVSSGTNKLFPQERKSRSIDILGEELGVVNAFDHMLTGGAATSADPQPPSLNPNPSTLKPQPSPLSTINPDLSTLTLDPSPLNPQASVLSSDSDPSRVLGDTSLFGMIDHVLLSPALSQHLRSVRIRHDLLPLPPPDVTLAAMRASGTAGRLSEALGSVVGTGSDHVPVHVLLDFAQKGREASGEANLS